MKYLSSIDNRKQRNPINHFQSEATALAHLKTYDIEPIEGKFTCIAERHFGDKTFDALDFLMINHNYKIHWV